MAKPKTKTNNESKIAAATLRLAARQSWGQLTLDQIARAAKISPTQLRKIFSNKDDILPAIIRFIDEETATAIRKPNPKDSPRDRLFEGMMGRLDIVQSHRRAILGIMDEVQSQPGTMFRRLLPVQAEAMRKMLGLSGVAPKGPGEPLAVAGLLGIYVLTLCTWRKDNSQDMSKTMAALDRYLRRVVPIAEILFRT